MIFCFTVSVINDRSKTDFHRAKIKLTGHFDWRPLSPVILSTEGKQALLTPVF
jgi:hypothetical protein